MVVFVPTTRRRMRESSLCRFRSRLLEKEKIIEEKHGNNHDRRSRGRRNLIKQTVAFRQGYCNKLRPAAQQLSQGLSIKN